MRAKFNIFLALAHVVETAISETAFVVWVILVGLAFVAALVVAGIAVAVVLTVDGFRKLAMCMNFCRDDAQAENTNF